MSKQQGEGLEKEIPKEELRGKAIGGVANVIGLRITKQVFQMLGMIVLARLIVPEHFGLIAMASVFTGILVEFGTLRISDAIIQADDVSQDQMTTLFWLSTGLCALLSLTGILAGKILAMVYGEPRLVFITQLLFLGFLFAGLSSLHLALLTRHMQFFAAGMIEVVATIVAYLAAIVVALLVTEGYWALIVRHLSLPAVITIGAWMCCSWRPGRPLYCREAMPLVIFGLHGLGSYCLTYLNRSMDKFLVGWRFGAASLAFYDRSYQLFVLPVNQVVFPVTGVAVSTLRRLRDQPKEFLSYYLKALSLVGFVGMALSVVIASTSRDLVYVLLGEKWNFAGDILQYMGCGAGLFLIYNTKAWLFYSLGRADKLLRLNLVGTAATAIMFLVGLQFGVIGVAIAFAASSGFLIVPALWYGGNEIGLKLRMIAGALAAPTVACALTIVLVAWIVPQLPWLDGLYDGLKPIFRLPVMALLSALVYVALVCLLQRNLQPFRDMWEIWTELRKRGLKRD